MPHVRLERRRSQRLPPASGRAPLVLHTTLQVRVIDVSSAGMLLESAAPLAIGDRGEVQAVIGSRSVWIPIEVRRISVDAVSPTDFRYRIGAVFSPVNVDEHAAITSLFGGSRE